MYQRDRVESESRAAARSVYLGNGAVLAVVHGRHRMILDSTDRGIVPHLCFDGFWESWVTTWVMNNVRQGHVAVNVGANVGYYAILLASLVGENGRVVAVEPNVIHCDNIEASAHLNGFHGFLVVERCVASNQPGEVLLATRPGMSMNAHVVRTTEPHHGPNEKLSAVLARRIDDMVEGRVDFVLVDSEGHEFEVLQGMECKIRENRHLTMVIEWSPARYPDRAQFLKWLRGLGFTASEIFTTGADYPINDHKLLESVERMIVLRR